MVDQLIIPRCRVHGWMRDDAGPDTAAGVNHIIVTTRPHYKPALNDYQRIHDPCVEYISARPNGWLAVPCASPPTVTVSQCDITIHGHSGVYCVIGCHVIKYRDL